MARNTYLKTARRVINQEAEALGKLAESLGEEFSRAVEMILAAKGRVIVSGMGKSGHIAGKIAATLASTGTPAQFVHPAEASHGDLGMVTSNDIVLVLSNSGETAELAEIIAYTRRFSIPMIGIASNPESSLLRQCDLKLVLPRAKEACPMGMAPTTSTTMTLALGYALAVALMVHRAFSKENYRILHPGGNLGARLKNVGDLMHSGDALPLARKHTPMSDALLTISQMGFGVVGVTDREGYLLGIVTDGDLRRNMAGLLDLTAGEVMTTSPRTISSDALAEEAVAVMNERKITCLFVTNPTGPAHVAGILHIHDCLRAGVV